VESAGHRIEGRRSDRKGGHHTHRSAYPSDPR
jgi:hypothetical protein